MVRCCTATPAHLCVHTSLYFPQTLFITPRGRDECSSHVQALKHSRHTQTCSISPSSHQQLVCRYPPPVRTYSLPSHAVPQRRSLLALVLTHIQYGFFCTVQSRSLVAVWKPSASAHINTASYSQTSLLTLKNPWPLGPSAAAHPNASSCRPFISRNVRLARCVVDQHQ